ncbi:sensor histidine kinase [uncultured Pseudokineococcus sp.]|uniref:sensor histidine kinase n=1 Tax=uncultured Pseudokineococcus sp. TaxID=1642928 RepID=UPI002608DB7D|nr:histidine kinase [uncultured Pseudokineococcus sp.]
MTSTTAPAPAARSAPDARADRRREGRSRWRSAAQVAGAVAHLAAMFVIGITVLTVLVTLLGLGIGLLPLMGLGALVLLALPYVLLAVAWFETARVDGLYGLDIPPLRPRRRAGPGVGGLLRTVWRQAADPLVWRAVTSLAVATLLGVLLLPVVSVGASGAALALAPLYAEGEEVSLGVFDVAVERAPLVGALVVLVALAAVVGLALLHGVVTRALLRASREAELVEQAQTSDHRRAGAVRAAEVERTRIERDLHDGVQPRLVSVGMTLGMARQKLDQPEPDAGAARALLDEAHTGTKAAITELRQLARGIHASVLDDRGLDAALSALAARSPVPVDLDVRVDGRCGRTAEAAVYFAVAESLTNAAKHARASRCRVVVRHRDGGVLWARVEDDGVGGARVLPGGGLDGIANRLAAAGGSSHLDSPRGGPTALEVGVPCAS